VTGEETQTIDGSWSPDGRSITYAATDPEHRDSSYVWVMDAQGMSAPRKVCRGNFVVWVSDSTLLVYDNVRTLIVSAPDARVIRSSQDSTLVYPGSAFDTVVDQRAGKNGYWIQRHEQGPGSLTRLDVAPSDVVAFPRQSPFLLCFNDSVGLYRYWPLQHKRERVNQTFPGLTVNSRIVMNWDDREFAYIAPGVTSRLMLITGWR